MLGCRSLPLRLRPFPTRRIANEHTSTDTRAGHKTDTVFSRYNIVSEADIRDAARKIEEGAKAANAIRSSFIAEAENKADAGKETARKPS